MEYLSTAEAAKKWQVSPRQVQRLLAHGRIPCARKCGRAWMIPADARKPDGPRKEKEPKGGSSFEDFVQVCAATTIPMPREKPDSILDTVSEERLRLQYEGELAYLRGNFRNTIKCYQKPAGDDMARLRASPVAIAAAIRLGDYRAYTEIETWLKGCASAHPDCAAFAQLALATAAVSVIAPRMAPEWLVKGNSAPAGGYLHLPDADRPRHGRHAFQLHGFGRASHGGYADAWCESRR